jgi:hypothetical protein
MTIMRTTLAMVTVASILAACGGGGGGSAGTGNTGGTGGNNTPPPAPPPATENGVFIDSAVAGIHYQTATQSGETDAEGRFKYLPGETVTFSIGGITLPPVAASDTVTPLMVFETSDFTDPRVVNLGRLLQSLDDDGNLDNGIQITAEARTAATGVTLDFAVPTATFEANTSVVNLLAAGGGSVTLVSAEDAIAHMQEQAAQNNLSLVGSWFIAEEGALISVTLFPNGTYVIAEDGEADDSGEPGYEYGTYSWDPVSGELTAEAIADANGEWGLSHPLGEMRVTRDGDAITFRETEDPEETVFDRVVADAENSIVGTWTVDGQPEGQLSVFVFLPDGHYILTDAGAEEDEAGGPGLEHGTYTWDAETSAFTLGEILTDMNGEWGISDETFTSVEVDGDTMTATFESGEVVTLTRLK